MKGREILFSSKSDDWGSPDLIYNYYVKELGYIDPCPLNASFDCLSDDFKWEGCLFINPPYSKIKQFVDKFKEHRAVWLVPSRTDTKWFHDLVDTYFSGEMYFIKGRLKFGDSKQSAPFPSVLIFNNNYVNDCPKDLKGVWMK